MVIVTIRKQDGSIYWKDTFPNLKTAQTWVETEKTRKYWDSTYQVDIEDRTLENQQAEAARKAAEAARLAAYNQALQQLKDLRNKPGKTPADVVALVEMIADFILGNK